MENFSHKVFLIVILCSAIFFIPKLAFRLNHWSQMDYLYNDFMNFLKL